MHQHVPLVEAREKGTKNRPAADQPRVGRMCSRHSIQTLTHQNPTLCWGMKNRDKTWNRLQKVFTLQRESMIDTLKKLFVDVHVNGCLLTFRVDTGADVSLLDEESWNRIGQPELCEGREQLRNASGQLRTFKGVTRAQVCHCNTTMPIQFYDRQGKGFNLLGMDRVKEVGLAKVCFEFLESVGSSSGVLLTESFSRERQLERTLEKFSDGFQHKLGCCSYTGGDFLISLLGLRLVLNCVGLI